MEAVPAREVRRWKRKLFAFAEELRKIRDNEPLCELLQDEDLEDARLCVLTLAHDLSLELRERGCKP
jgi:hypothetical protein